MKAIFRSGFLALAIMALAVPANSGPLEDGLAAYDRGDYATALEIWIPLAEQGDADSQLGLGVLYGNGQGFSKNDDEAVK
jgi:TPR repeat protein